MEKYKIFAAVTLITVPTLITPSSFGSGRPNVVVATEKRLIRLGTFAWFGRLNPSKTPTLF